MADIVLVAVTFAFIALCIAYIGWCDRIIGPDDFGTDDSGSEDSAADESGALWAESVTA